MRIPIPRANIFFDCDQALCKIRDFNNEPNFVAGDWLAKHLCTNPQQADPTGLVVAISYLMKANVIPKDQALISERLANHWQEIVAILDEVPADALETNPHDLCESAIRLLPILVEVDEQDRHNYVFATKLLHWVSRGHMPMLDGRARKCVRALQQNPPGDVNPQAQILRQWRPGRFCEDYKRWVYFYSHLINGIQLEMKEDLVEGDWQSQQIDACERWASRNTLVRVLDKYFWIEGEHNEGE